MLLDDAAHRLRKLLQLIGRGAELLEEGTQRFGRSAGSPGRFDLSPLSDPDRAIFLEGADGAAHLRRLQPLSRPDVLDRQAPAGLACVSDRREDALHGRVFFEVVFTNLGEGHDLGDALGFHPDEGFGQQPLHRHAELGRLERRRLPEFLLAEGHMRGLRLVTAERGQDLDFQRVQTVDERCGVHETS